MSLSKTFNQLLSKTRKACPDMTEKLMTGGKESNKKSLYVQSTRKAAVVTLVFSIPVTLC